MRARKLITKALEVFRRMLQRRERQVGEQGEGGGVFFGGQTRKGDNI